jgi:hypothetical protein
VQSEPEPTTTFASKSRTEENHLNSNEIQPNIATSSSSVDLHIPLSTSRTLEIVENSEILAPQIVPLDAKKIGGEFKPPHNVMRTIKLPETHIFTPVKGTNSISQEVTEYSPPLETMNGIAFKEYHDVEYKLDKPKGDDILSGFFVENFDKVLEPQKVAEFTWGNEGNPVNHQTVNHQKFNQTVEKNLTDYHGKAKPNLLSPVLKPKQKENFSKPVFGTSPTEGTKNCDEFDEDFSDFQAAPLPPQSFSQFNNCNETAGVKISDANDDKKSQSFGWNDSLIDAKEIARIEAAFPKCKVVNEKKEKEKEVERPKVSEDDEWSEFVSPPTVEQTVLKTGKEKEKQRESIVNNNDEWSDFVAVPPKLTNNRDFSLSSQMLSGPSFPSWNQPSLPPPPMYFNANGNNNFLNLTNNIGYGANDGSKMQRTNQQFTQGRNPNVSLIPELDFSMPKNSIKLPYNNFGNLSKK